MKLTAHQADLVAKFLNALNEASRRTGISVDMATLWLDGDVIGSLGYNGSVADLTGADRYYVESTD